MEILTKFKECTDPLEKKVIEKHLNKEIIKTCYRANDVDSKVTASENVIKRETEKLTTLNDQAKGLQETLITIMREVAVVGTKTTTHLVLPEVALSCKKTEVLETDPSFDDDLFLNYEVNILCNSKKEKDALLKLMAEHKYEIKKESKKILGTVLKKHLESFTVEGARIVNNFFVSFKLK
jgi:hypothetical protein